jgi:hypothetical protein
MPVLALFLAWVVLLPQDWQGKKTSWGVRPYEQIYGEDVSECDDILNADIFSTQYSNTDIYSTVCT